MNNLLPEIAEWVRKEQGAEDGVLRRFVVQEPTEEQTKKAFIFSFENDAVYIRAIVWETGDYVLDKIDFTVSLDTSEEDGIFCDTAWFDEPEPLLKKLEDFLRMNLPPEV